MNVTLAGEGVGVTSWDRAFPATPTPATLLLNGARSPLSYDTPQRGEARGAPIGCSGTVLSRSQAAEGGRRGT